MSRHIAASASIDSPPVTHLLTMHTSQTLSDMAVTPSLTTSSLRQHPTHMPTLSFLSKTYFSLHTAANAPMKSPPAPRLLTVHISQQTSNKLVFPHLAFSSSGQSKAHKLTHHFLPKPYVSHHIAVSAPINRPPAIHMLTINTSQTTPDKSINPFFNGFSRRQQQAYMRTRFLFSRPYVSRHIAISGPLYSSSATHVPK